MNFITEHLPKGQYMAGPTRKQWIFLHHTAGWDSPINTIRGWATDQRGSVATEFVLGGQKIDNTSRHDGVLVQAFPQGGYAWHLGTGNNTMHRNSVGIEICSFGNLSKGGYRKAGKWIALEPESYYTYVGGKVHPDQITTTDKFRNFTHWHKYSDRQIQVLKDWILYIANRDSIDPRKGIVELIKSRGPIKAFDITNVAMCENTKGMWLHTNVRTDKVDLFPQDNLIEMLLSL